MSPTRQPRRKRREIYATDVVCAGLEPRLLLAANVFADINQQVASGESGWFVRHDAHVGKGGRTQAATW